MVDRDPQVGLGQDVGDAPTAVPEHAAVIGATRGTRRRSPGPSRHSRRASGTLAVSWLDDRRPGVGTSVRTSAGPCSSPRSRAGTTPATPPPAPPTGSSASTIRSVSRRIDPDEHLDYQSHRPQVELVDGVARAITWPANDCFAVTFGERDLVVLRGVEPNVRWKSFCQRGARRSRRRPAARWSSPSARCSATCPTPAPCASPAPPPIPSSSTGSSSNGSQYEGPTGIVGVLHDACRASGLRSASLWAPVPHYVSPPPEPARDARAARTRSAQLADLDLDLHGLDQLVDLWRVQVDHAIRDNDEVSTYVRELEGRVDAEDADDAASCSAGTRRAVVRPRRRRARRRGGAVPARAGRRVVTSFSTWVFALAYARRGRVGHDRRCASSPACCSCSFSTGQVRRPRRGERPTSTTTASRRPRWPPTSSGALELVGGLLLVVGLLTRPAALLLAVNMVGAIATAGRVDGGTFHLGVAPTMLVAMLFLVWAGCGRLALDRC